MMDLWYHQIFLFFLHITPLIVFVTRVILEGLREVWTPAWEPLLPIIREHARLTREVGGTDASAHLNQHSSNQNKPKCQLHAEKGTAAAAHVIKVHSAPSYQGIFGLDLGQVLSTPEETISHMKFIYASLMRRDYNQPPFEKVFFFSSPHLLAHTFFSLFC